MDIERTFSFVFDDPRWLTKVLIGGLVALIPFIGQFVVMGYGFTVARNLARGVETPLPEWDEFVDIMLRGLIAAVISLVYSLPILALGGCFVLLIGLGAAANEGSRGGGALVGLLGLCLFPLIIVAVVLIGMVAHVAVARYLTTNDFGAAFQLGAVITNLREHIRTWLMLLLISILAGVVASLGFIAFGIGVLFTSFYAQCMIGHGLGQAMRLTMPGMAPPAAEAAPPPPPLA